MTHTVSSPPPDGGGNGLVAEGTAKASFVWTPPHDMSPREERRRIEKGVRMRLDMEAMFNAPAGHEE